MKITELKGVGPETAARLEKLHLRSIEDLLFHFPLRYQDKTRIVPIGELRPGQAALIEGRVVDARVAYTGRRVLIVQVGDDSGWLQLRFFHFSMAQKAGFQPGQKLCAYGEVRSTRAALEIIHPEYRLFGAHHAAPLERYYTPVYPATEGLAQKSLRRLARAAVAWFQKPENQLEELLPGEVVRELGAAGAIATQEALCLLHEPPAGTDLALLTEGRHPARKRLAFEELLANVLSLKRLRARQRRHKAWVLDCEGRLFRELTRALPFALTAAQRKVIGEIRQDVRRESPMMRLVQGDVGSGKTLVATAALLQAIEAGFQAALMAPTEILAEQHYDNLRELLASSGVSVCALSGRQKTRARQAALRRIRDGRAQLTIGTHALFQEAVEFPRLAMIVVDEQHRFGVHQRLLLKEKGAHGEVRPHQLIMTATPIPRSLAMTMYADLDYSVIDELPPGRRRIKTVALPETRRDEVITRLHESCRDGAQAYWVCPLIEESESLQCRAAEASYRHLRDVMPDLKLGLIHGNLHGDEKEAVMRAFKDGAVNVLVATTVIEVGVDVANATLMIIDNAERLGLAQLHQLRGRVGRGRRQSSCVLIYAPPLSDKAERRIRVMRKSNDGFEIAAEDMRLRGPGEIMGTRQAGQIHFRVADLSCDAEQVQQVLKVADDFATRHPRRTEKLTQRWLGKFARYAEV